MPRYILLLLCLATGALAQEGRFPWDKSLPQAVPSDAEAELSVLQTAKLPGQAPYSVDGHHLAAALEPMPIKSREDALLELFARGYFPDFLRKLKPISVTDGKHALTYWVMPDYLSVGHDFDYVLMPLTWFSVKKLAKAWNFVLPTPKMVDQIYRRADRHLWPRAQPPRPEMVNMPAILEHNSRLFAAERLEPLPDLLFAGHKKDIVLSRQLLRKKDRIAIYGWQNLSAGENIQPLCIWHGKNYVDYSHGVRFVGSWVMLDGKATPIARVLADPETAGLLSDEGPLAIERLLRPDADPTMEARVLAH